jgi:hypothetical protein
MNPDLTFLKEDIVHLQRQCLSNPKSGPEEKKEERIPLRFIGLNGLQEALFLLRGEWDHEIVSG